MKPASYLLPSILFLFTAPYAISNLLLDPKVSKTFTVAGRYDLLSFLARDRDDARMRRDKKDHILEQTPIPVSTRSYEQTSWFFVRWLPWKDEVRILIRQDDTIPGIPTDSEGSYHHLDFNIGDASAAPRSYLPSSPAPKRNPWDMIRSLDFEPLLLWTKSAAPIVIGLLFLFFISGIVLQAGQFIWKFMVVVRFIVLFHRKIRQMGEERMVTPLWKAEDWEEEEAEEDAIMSGDSR